MYMYNYAEKGIQFVLANNTTLLGNVMVGGEVHSTVPGAGGVIEPDVCLLFLE